MKLKIFAEGEVIAGAWSRRVEKSEGTTDAFLKLYTPDESIVDAFSKLAADDLRGQKREGGKMFFIQIFEIEEPVQSDFQAITFEQHEPVNPSQKAAIICKDEHFFKFIAETFPDEIRFLINSGLWHTEKGSTAVAEADRRNHNGAVLVRYIASVDSRSELDSNEFARSIFDEMIDSNFNKWKKQKGLK